jgi:hypothetical protein
MKSVHIFVSKTYTAGVGEPGTDVRGAKQQEGGANYTAKSATVFTN